MCFLVNDTRIEESFSQPHEFSIKFCKKEAPDFKQTVEAKSYDEWKSDKGSAQSSRMYRWMELKLKVDSKYFEMMK